MTRYSVIGAPVDKVLEVGGMNIKNKLITKIIFADMSEQQASKLRRMGYAVEKVDKIKPSPVAPPTQIESKATYSPSQLLDMIGIDSIRGLSIIPLNGQGYNIAVLDSGIRETHEALRGRIVYSGNFTADPIGDKFNHGTGIASVLAATVPLSGIMDMKIFGDNGEGSSESVVDAIEECIALHEYSPNVAPSVIGLSLGAPDTGNINDAMRVACRAAAEKGIWVIAAAGNDGPEPSTIMTPACDDLVIAVGSLSPSLFTVSTFSSRGPTEEGLIKPDFMMFGEDLSVASSEGDEAIVARSGTSFAVPFMAGLCVLCYDAMASRGLLGNHGNGYASEPEELIDVVESQFPRFCVKPEDSPAGKDNDCGYGVPVGSYVVQALGNGSRASVEPTLPTVALNGLLSASVIGMMARFMKI